MWQENLAESVKETGRKGEEFRISDRERFAQQNLMSGMWVRLWERVIFMFNL
ncbi:hypothetical protein ES708_13569 [subsurface metagenome]